MEASMRGMKGARFFGVLVLAAFGAIATAWYVTVTAERERYLTSRNFRILTTIADELQSSIDTQERTFTTLLTAPFDATDPSDQTLQTRLDTARPYIPILDAMDTTRTPTTLIASDPGAERHTNLNQAIVDADETWLQLSIIRAPAPESAAPEQRNVWLRLGSVVGPIFEPTLRDGAFDTLALAAVDGRVLHVAGERRDVLNLTSLDRLAPVSRPRLVLGGTADTPAPGFTAVARTSGVADVVIAGTVYRLFTQPCCVATPVRIGENGTQIRAPSLVVVGLVPISEFSSKARQIPPTAVIACIAVILIAFAGWPFLKLKLIGERHRVHRLDVVEVIACGLLGIALLTIVCLDVYAYRHLNDTRDRQLQGLARSISTNTERELTAAFLQLHDLRRLAATCGSSVTTDDQIFAPWSRVATCAAALGEPMPATIYPHFKTVAFIDGKGFQAVKWTSRRWLPRPIPVDGREYYTNARDGAVWAPLAGASLPKTAWSCNPGYVLQSIWSWTTSEPEAVLAIPSCGKLPVAALTIPMSSLIAPVLPAGFEFAVITEQGDVVFHSDPQRNTHENLFRETDRNPRLRAAVISHSEAAIDLRYAGRSYRAFVHRLGAGTPWSIVTLSNNEGAWALHTEWLVLALAALFGYMTVLAAVFGLCFFTGRSDWLWADVRQVQRYRALFGVVAGLSVAAVATLWFAGNAVLIVLSFVIPLLAWAICYAVIRRAPGDDDSGRDAYVEYVALAMLLFLLAGVFPAAGFFTAAYRLQVRTDVKYAQLQLARSIVPRMERLRRLEAAVPGGNVAAALEPDGLPSDVYSQFLFGTDVRFEPMTPPADARRESRDASASSAVETVVEEYVPYYSERSVQMRELLLHRAASDGAWWWRTQTPARLELVLNGDGTRSSVVVASVPPRLFQGVLQGRGLEHSVLLALSWAMLVGLVWTVVHFIETHICLRGVDQPMWSKTRVTTSSGDNLFVICDPVDRAGFAADAFEIRLESLPGEQDLVRALMELDRTQPGLPVLAADFDDNLDDPKRARQKLGYIERLAADQSRTVIILSSASPAALEQAFDLGSGQDASVLERWQKVLASFVVINWRGARRRMSGEAAAPVLAAAAAHPEPAFRIASGTEAAFVPPGSLWSDVRDTLRDGAGTAVVAALDRRRSRQVRHTLREEAAADAFVRAICVSIEQRLDSPASEAAHPAVRLSSDQVLDEVADRAESWYRRIWRSCSPDERLVLADVAAEGFANHKSRRTVRRLLGRGLIAKDPSFRLMNTTFRRFVLSPWCQADVHAIEGATAPSPWERLRVPFFTVLVGAALFFLLTQRELFNVTIAALTTLTAALPVLARFVAAMTGKRIETDAKS
jgi:hypothetical protein